MSTAISATSTKNTVRMLVPPSKPAMNGLLAIPTSDASGSATDMFAQLGVAPIVIGVVVAALSAAAAVRWLVGFLNRHGLTAFGWYRIVVGICLLGLVLGGVVRVGE